MVRELETNVITSSKENPKEKKNGHQECQNEPGKEKQTGFFHNEEGKSVKSLAEFIGVHIENNYLYYYPFSISLLLILQSCIIAPREWNGQILQNQIT